MVVIKPLRWDSHHFGIKICRVKVELGDKPEQLVSSLAQGDMAFASARVDVEDALRVQLLEKAGFRIADVRTYMNMKLVRFKAPKMASDTSVIDYETGHHEFLKQIAKTSFWSDHFHADPRFDRSKVDEMYALWVDKCVRERYTILVACREGVPVGFLAGKKVGAAHHIELVAVSKSLRGHGVGHDLVVCALTKASGPFNEATVAVQLTNTSALRLYERIGFRIARSEFTFHWWRT